MTIIKKYKIAYMKRQLLTFLIVLSAFCTMAQKTILINNVQIFNGKDEKTIIGNVLIVNNLISNLQVQAKISSSP